MRKIICFVVLLINGIIAIRLPAQEIDLEELYRKAQFEKIVSIFLPKRFEELTMEHKFLFLESLARTGEGFRAVPYLNGLLSNCEIDDALLTTSGIVYHSIGDFSLSEKFLKKAVALNPENDKALYCLALLKVYQRNFREAVFYYEKAVKADFNRDDNLFGLLIGSRVYESSYNVALIKAHYEKLKSYYKRGENRKGFLKYEKEVNLLNRINGEQLFSTKIPEGKIELPIVDFNSDSFYKCLLLRVDDKEYKVLLDTGNAPGWTIHNPELIDSLSNYFGSKQSTSTGSVEHEFQSDSVIIEKIDFCGLKLFNLKGYYFKKPRENYFDANLNPLFIRDYVVSIDFINNKFILRTPEQFKKDLREIEAALITKVPLYGDQWPFIPVKVNGYAEALAMIETGAEDLSAKLEFAEFIHMPLTAATKEFRQKKYDYHKGKLEVMLGEFLFQRPEVEIWPKRFFDTECGLYDHIMIGPWALEGNYILHIDPVKNEVILQKSGKKAGT